MADRIPFIVFGDGPRLTSGLARIARDVTARLVAHSEALGIRVVQVGVDFPEGLHWQSWDFYGFQPTKRDYGRTMLAEVIEQLRAEGEEQDPIILTMTDPSRVFDITRSRYDTIEDDQTIDTKRIWAYCPIDSHTPQGTIGGPAAAAVWECERVLAYGRYGATVLQRTINNQWARLPEDRRTALNQTVPFLPHGIELNVFMPDRGPAADLFFQTWLRPLRERDAIILGAVATNQPRKDLGLLFATVAELKRTRPVGLWLVTDQLTNAWDIGELAYQFALEPREVCVVTSDQGPPLTDLQLAGRYALSDVTIAPGLGEGFGYPIVESLACGTPVVHGKYAGGVELIPVPAWLVEPVAWRLESAYVLQRPVFRPADMAVAVIKAVSWASGMAGRTAAAYCRGSVQHLDWRYLWPRWEAWVKRGLAHGRSGTAKPLRAVEADGGRQPAESV